MVSSNAVAACRRPYTILVCSVRATAGRLYTFFAPFAFFAAKFPIRWADTEVRPYV